MKASSSKHFIDIKDDRAKAMELLAAATGWEMNDYDYHSPEVNGIMVDINYEYERFLPGRVKGLKDVELSFKDSANEYKTVRRAVKAQDGFVDIEKLKQKMAELQELLGQSKEKYEALQEAKKNRMLIEEEVRDRAASLGVEGLHQVEKVSIRSFVSTDVELQINHLTPELAAKVIQFIQDSHGC